MGIKMISEWIKVEDELPPEDGNYEVSNDPEMESNWWSRHNVDIVYYDGYGFQCGGVYRSPYYWRKITRSEKKYGKLTKV